MRRVTGIFGGDPKPPAGGNPDSNTLISDMTTVRIRLCLGWWWSGLVGFSWVVRPPTRWSGRWTGGVRVVPTGRSHGLFDPPPVGPPTLGLAGARL